MAGIRKHGAHRYTVSVGPFAAVSAATVGAGVMVYDAFAAGNTTATATAGVDSTQEVVSEIALSYAATYTGQATNFNTISVVQWGPTGTVKNSMAIAYSAAGVTSTLLTPINYGAITATGQSPNNVGTGTVTLVGTGLPWSLNNGDQIGLLVVATGTGQAIPQINMTFLVQAKGA